MDLATGESVLAQERFIQSLGRFLVHTTVWLTRGRVTYVRRNALLGLIPLGTQTDTYPLANISAVGTGTHIRLLRLLDGIILGAVGVGLFLSVYVVGAFPIVDLQVTASDWWPLPLALLLVLYGLQATLDAFQARFYVSTSGGQTYSMAIALTSKPRAQALAEQVNKAIVQLHANRDSKVTV